MTNEQEIVFYKKMEILFRIIEGKKERIYFRRGILGHEFQFERSVGSNRMYMYHRIGYIDKIYQDKNGGRQILIEMLSYDEFGKAFNYPIRNVPEIWHEMKIMPYKNSVDFEKLFSKMDELLVRLV